MLHFVGLWQPPSQPPQPNSPTYHIKGQTFPALSIRQNKLGGADSPTTGVNLQDAGLVAPAEELNEGEWEGSETGREFSKLQFGHRQRITREDKKQVVMGLSQRLQSYQTLIRYFKMIFLDKASLFE